MSNSTQIYRQQFSFLRQYSHYRDLRHLIALGWMVSTLICSGQLSLSAWEAYVPSRALKAQSVERRWQRFVCNQLIDIHKVYVPLVMLALKDWQSHRLYLALDTTVLWNQYCMIHVSVVCCGRAVPFLWQVLEHKSAAVAFEEYQSLLRRARWLLRGHPDVMVLADRGFANHSLMSWLQQSRWHYCLRMPGDLIVHGSRRCPREVRQLWPSKGQAVLYHNVGLWEDGLYRSNLVLANIRGAKQLWAVITDESPRLQTLWQYALRFQVEELFLDSKSGAFKLEESKIRCAHALERLYWVAAVALLYSTTHGMAVHIKGLREQVDPHWRRGISYLKIGLRWLKGVVHKGRQLLMPVPLLMSDPQPCFSSKKAQKKFYNKIWFSRIRSLLCKVP